MKERLIRTLNVASKPHVAIPGALILGGAIVGFAWYATNLSPSGSYSPVTAGSLTEEVDVTGAVKAAHATDLSFQTTGQVAAINVAVGDHVQAGQVLVSLASAQQAAALAGARANLEMQEAKLAALKSGTRPEQLSIDQTALAQADSALADAVKSASVSADDAVHVKADVVFTSPRTSNAELTIQVPDASLAARLVSERVALEPLFTSWIADLSSATATPTSAAAEAETDLKTIGTFLDDLATALAETQPGGSISATTLAADQAGVNTGRTNVSSALAAVTTADTSRKSAEGTLMLAQAGATANDVAAQQALVDAAQAAVATAQVALAQTSITAPVSGTISVQNAELGETVAPGTPLVSIISDGKYEAQAQISDADIAKVKIGETVTATFDAYPGISFPASVTTVDPAATITNGVASYGLTVTFNDNDPRIKPGLSANLRVITATKDNALSVPTSAIITNGSAHFVYVRGNKAPVETPVEIGIQTTDGRTEITSGLSVGQQVLTFGSAASQ